MSDISDFYASIRGKVPTSHDISASTSLRRVALFSSRGLSPFLLSASAISAIPNDLYLPR